MIEYIGRGNPVIYIHGDISSARELHYRAGGGFTLGVIGNIDWNRDLSPWSAEKVFKDGEAFSGGGGEYLKRLAGRLIPEAEAGLGFAPVERGIAGYSLAGLFALYAFLNSELFRLAGSVSGSLWYDGWLDYVNKAATRTEKKGKVYLSVGDGEGHARNRRMKSVVENTRLTQAALCGAGMETLFELNRGGHFEDEQGRLERCLTWLAGKRA